MTRLFGIQYGPASARVSAGLPILVFPELDGAALGIPDPGGPASGMLLDAVDLDSCGAAALHHLPQVLHYIAENESGGLRRRLRIGFKQRPDGPPGQLRVLRVGLIEVAVVGTVPAVVFGSKPEVLGVPVGQGPGACRVDRHAPDRLHGGQNVSDTVSETAASRNNREVHVELEEEPFSNEVAKAVENGVAVAVLRGALIGP